MLVPGRKRVAQPPPTRLVSGPLSRGVTYAVSGSAPLLDLVSHSSAAAIGSPPLLAVPSGGLGLSLNGSNQSIDTGRKFTSSAGTLLLLTYLRSSVTGSAVVACQSYDDAGNAVGLGWQGSAFYVGGGGQRAYVNPDASAIPIGLQCLVGTWSGSTGIAAYRNGVLGEALPSNTSPPTAPAGAYYFEIGCFRYNGGRVFFTNESPLLFVVWDRALPAAEVKAVSANPWQLFKTPRRLWVAPATSAAPSFTATQEFPAFGASQTAQASAQASVSHALAAFGQTATAAAVGVSSASQALAAFGQSATAAAVGAASASQVLAPFGQSAALAARATLTATLEAPAFGQSATAAAVAALAGSQGVPAFGQTGTVASSMAAAASQVLAPFGQAATAAAVGVASASQALAPFGQAATLATGAAASLTAAQELQPFGGTAALTTSIAASVSQTVASFGQSATLVVRAAVAASQAVPAFDQSVALAATAAVDAAQTVASFGQSASAGTSTGATATQTVVPFGQTATLSAPIVRLLAASQELSAFGAAPTLRAIARASAAQTLPAFGQVALLGGPAVSLPARPASATPTTIVGRLTKELLDGRGPLSRPTSTPAVPTAKADVGALFKTVQALKQIADTREGTSGSVLDKTLTLRDLMDAGSLRINIGARTLGSTGGGALELPGAPTFEDTRPLLDVPPAPTNLTAVGVFKNIIIEWDLPNYRNHDYSEIWRSAADNLGTAALIGVAVGRQYIDATGVLGTTYYYWVRDVLLNAAGQTVAGPFNAVAGVSAGLGLIGGTDLAPLIVEARHLAAATPSLISDQTFETWNASTNRLQWLPRTDAAVPATCPYPYAGQFNSRDSLGPTRVVVFPGEQFRVSLYVNRSGLGTTDAGVLVYFRDVADASVSFATAGVATPGTPSSAWERVTVNVQAPAGATTMLVGPWISQAHGGTQTAWFTGLLVEKKIDATLVTANMIVAGSGAIGNLAVENAMLANAAVDDAKIANLSAAKLTAGTGVIGGNLKSSNYSAGSAGWILTPAGGAEFSAAVIRDQLVASQIDSRNLTIKDAAGNIVLSSGVVRLRGTNLMDPSWWAIGAALRWASNDANGSVTEFVQGTRPDGSPGIVMRATAGSISGTSESSGGGGWNPNSDATNGWPVDKTKEHLLAVYIQRASGGAVLGNAYWGINPNDVCAVNTTTPDGNPYFANLNQSAMTAGRWYLFVGKVFPYGSTGNSNSGAGIYDCATGALVASGLNFNWANITFCAGTRAYMYYANGAVQFFSNPQVYVCDGTEPTLANLLAMGSVSARNQITSGNASTYIANASIGTAQIANASIGTAQVSSLNASVITAGTITTDRLVAGAVTAAAGSSSSATSTGFTSVSSLSKVDNSFITMTTTGAPVKALQTTRVEVDFSSGAVSSVEVTVALTRDGSVVGNSPTVRSNVSAISAGHLIVDVVVPRIARESPSAATHTWGYSVSVSFKDSSGAPVSCTGSWFCECTMLVEENKV